MIKDQPTLYSHKGEEWERYKRMGTSKRQLAFKCYHSNSPKTRPEAIRRVTVSIQKNCILSDREAEKMAVAKTDHSITLCKDLEN